MAQYLLDTNVLISMFRNKGNVKYSLFFDFQSLNHIIFSNLLVALLLVLNFTVVNFTVVKFTRMKFKYKEDKI